METTNLQNGALLHVEPLVHDRRVVFRISVKMDGRQIREKIVPASDIMTELAEAGISIGQALAIGLQTHGENWLMSAIRGFLGRSPEQKSLPETTHVTQVRIP